VLLPGSVVGVGVDMVEVSRITALSERHPSFIERILTPRERALALTPSSIAGRWAAKEAVIKVLVDSRGLAWHECEVLKGAHGEPILEFSGAAAQAARDRGIDTWHASISHDGGMVIAMVVASHGGGA
jgi:holo-[acyl-carrier protein] synthase